MYNTKRFVYMGSFIAMIISKYIMYIIFLHSLCNRTLEFSEASVN